MATFFLADQQDCGASARSECQRDCRHGFCEFTSLSYLKYSDCWSHRLFWGSNVEKWRMRSAGVLSCWMHCSRFCVFCFSTFTSCCLGRFRNYPLHLVLQYHLLLYPVLSMSSCVRCYKCFGCSFLHQHSDSCMQDRLLSITSEFSDTDGFQVPE